MNCVDALVGTPRIDIAQVPHTDHGSQAAQRDNRSNAELRCAGRIKTKSLHYFRLHLLVEPFGYLPEWHRAWEWSWEVVGHGEARAGDG